ncbi:MAG TPA: YggT family protein [Gemmatimonadales bacterium]|nr:YggT family protein [Gemmatimonadales bacterium]
MFFPTLDLGARALVVFALVYASIVGLTTWAVRRRRLSPFGAWPRLVRRASDPILLPLERRIIRAGGSPQDAPLWLVVLVVLGGLLLLTLVHWLAGVAVSLSVVASSGPRALARFLVDALFALLMGAIFVRVIASWLGLSPYSRWMRPVVAATDWLIEPIRRILPPLGMFDMSPMVAWLILYVVRGFVLSWM